MSRIFVSYRRKSWGFTHRLADKLEQYLTADIFVDYEGVDEDDFEQSILRNLRECDLVLLIVTEYTFTDRIHRDDDWVRREIREALERNLPIILVAVDGQLPPKGLPEDIHDIDRKQGIEFYPNYFPAAVERLARFIVNLGISSYRKQQSVATRETIDDHILDRASLYEALDMLESGDYVQAIFLLETLQYQNFKTQYIDLDQILNRARYNQRIHAAKLGYEEVCMLAKRRFTVTQAREAWDLWCLDFADLVEDLDIHNLRDIFYINSPNNTSITQDNQQNINQITFEEFVSNWSFLKKVAYQINKRLPALLDWCEPFEVYDNVLIFGLTNPIFLPKFEKVAHEISQAVELVYGSYANFRIEIIKEEITQDNEIVHLISQDDFLTRAANELGAEISYLEENDE